MTALFPYGWMKITDVKLLAFAIFPFNSKAFELSIYLLKYTQFLQVPRSWCVGDPSMQQAHSLFRKLFKGRE